MSVKLEPGVAEVVPSTQATNPAIAELGDFVGEELHQAMAGLDPPAMVDTAAEGAAALNVIEPPLPAVDPAVIIEQAGRGLLDPNLSQEERRGRAQWTLAQLGFAPTPLNPPGPQPPSTSSHKPPPAAGRTPGMTMQQWDALQVPSGGGSSRPIASAKKSLRKRSAPKSSTVPTGKVPAQKGATLPDKPLSSRALKRQRPYIPWEPNPEQLRHAQLLLRGEAPYAVPEPTCLAVSDPRVSGPKGACKWMCPMQGCSKICSSQLDCKGHIQKDHNPIRSPSLCTCLVSTFTNAKALWDHLDLMHHIHVVEVKNNQVVALRPEPRDRR